MLRSRKMRLGDLALEAGLITEEQLQHVLTVQKETKKPLGSILIDYGFISEPQLIELLGKHLDIPHVNLSRVEIDPAVATSIPLDLARRYRVIPIKKEGKRLTLAMVDPMNVEALDSAALFTGCDVRPVIAGDSSICNLIEQYYGIKESVEKVRESENVYHIRSMGSENVLRQKDSVEEEPIVRLVNSIILRAVIEEASDIHLEPQGDGLRVRLRIDGILQELFSPPKNIQPQIISRIKIMASMDISEKRLPQDGRVLFTAGNKKINLRVSTLPTIFGEKVVLRLLNREKIVVPLDSLGFNPIDFKVFETIIKANSGMILVCGPTGCGKSTTLYSTLNYLNSKEKNIITVEDPVEYHLKGINQVQVNLKTGLTFSRALRTILRQDPNIIMVGEIRDLETAQIATRAALTGHLVFSTLHTNDAVRAITRLLDMGVEDYLLVSSVVGIVAQRLIRLICPHCKEEHRPLEEEKKLYLFYSDSDILPKFFKGTGCSYCNHTGYKGRTAVQEILFLSEELKKLILERTTPDEILQFIRIKKNNTLQQEGMKRAAEGITSISEVIRVTFQGSLGG